MPRRHAKNGPIHPGRPVHHRILVPLDGSASAECGLREAIALAAREQARLCLLHVLDDGTCRPGGRELLTRAREAANQAGVSADTALRQREGADVARAICDEADAEGCDLIVLGARGRRTGRRDALGRNARAVLAAARMPVLLVREEAPGTEALRGGFR